MEKKRFNEKRKVNQTSMICYAVLVFILFAAYMLELVKGNRTVGYIMIFDIILLAPLALALLTYKKNNESAALRYMITAGYGVLYVFVLLTSVTKLSFVYIIPMIIILTLYRDWKLVLAAGAASIAANVIFVFYYLGSISNTATDITEFAYGICGCSNKDSDKDQCAGNCRYKRARRAAAGGLWAYHGDKP